MKSLLDIMAALRDPQNGCPWDIKQDFASIVPYTLEEAYEVADAIERQDFAELKLELGDLLFQVVFYAQLAKEQQLFDFDDIVAGVSEKLIRRHPHVFGDLSLADEAAVKVNWEQEKAREREQKSQQQHASSASILDDIPLSFPALSRANKIQKRCANVGFDWPDVKGALDKVTEEVQELKQELDRPQQNEQAITEELGDLFFALVNVSRHLKQNPESVLRHASAKFERRFRQVEQMTIAKGDTVEDSSIEQLDNLWNAVKIMERQEGPG